MWRERESRCACECEHARTCVYMCELCVNVCARLYTHIRVSTQAHVCMNVYTHGAFLRKRVHTHVGDCVCKSVCVCV